MKKLLLHSFIVLSILTSCQTLYAQIAPTIQWDKTFGGNNHEDAQSIYETPDGKYLVAGSSGSDIGFDKSQACWGGPDYWIIKIDQNGNKIWDKSFGGDNYDALFSFQQTTDGGYILGGYSNSGISGNKSQACKGNYDYWIVKLDSAANKVWDKTFGGSGDDKLFSVIQTIDGGYILGGFSDSGISGDKTDASRGYEDYWVVKLDSIGNKLWDKTIGGNSTDHLISIKEISGGDLILGGYSRSTISGDKSEANKGGNGASDYWIVKLDPSGNKLWDRTYGGTWSDSFTSMSLTSDGGFILGGISNSGISGDKSETSKGGSDFWVIKVDVNGNKQWDKTIGGSSGDALWSLQQISDGGYILGGYSGSDISNDKSEASRGDVDFWVVKLDANGNKIWDKTIGGSDIDFLIYLRQTNDGGFILGGLSWSGITGDKSQLNKGFNDFWIVKLGPEITGLAEPQTTNLTLYPNPTTGLINLELKGQQPTQISVFNSLGQTILTKTEAQPNPDGKLQLDLSNQAKGIYTVQVISGNHSAVKKVVLQ